MSAAEAPDGLRDRHGVEAAFTRRPNHDHAHSRHRSPASTGNCRFCLRCRPFADRDRGPAVSPRKASRSKTGPIIPAARAKTWWDKAVRSRAKIRLRRRPTSRTTARLTLRSPCATVRPRRRFIRPTSSNTRGIGSRAPGRCSRDCTRSPGTEEGPPQVELRQVGPRWSGSPRKPNLSCCRRFVWEVP